MIGSLWLAGFVAAILLFHLVAIPALIMKRNDFADVFWGPAFPLCAFTAAALSRLDFSSLDLRKILVLALVAAWALRLFAHLGWRNLSHRNEDVRYANWRKAWGSSWIWRSYLQVFVLQSVILYVFMLPVFFILSSPIQSIGFIADIGVALWCVGMFFETVGDEQLRRFKSDPSNKGKLMTKGLWSWTRHPNYFGEILLWWGIWLIAFELPHSWWTVITPVAISFLIFKVSGVEMLEKLMRSRPGYAEYEKSVSKFFPRPPRHLHGKS